MSFYSFLAFQYENYVYASSKFLLENSSFVINSTTSIVIVFDIGRKKQKKNLFNLFLSLFISLIVLFSTIHKSYNTISGFSANF